MLFLIFNRPETTAIVFEAIRKARPAHLYIAADGARGHVAGELEKCLRTREIAVNVDWPCEVKTLFRESNLGCRVAVSSAIDWFFLNEKDGIILEDDCLPNHSFFAFCETLLEKYRYDTRVMHISGNNFQRGRLRGDGSYYFSKYPHIWGWASWKRSWDFYDVEMTTYERFIQQGQIRNVFRNKKLQHEWERSFDLVKSGQLDTWDHQWTYAILCQNGICILPNQNLVSNIGFGPGAHHTTSYNKSLADLPTSNIEIVIDPTFVIADYEADEFTTLKVFRVSPIQRIFRIGKKLIRVVTRT